MKKINIILLLCAFHFFWGQGISVKYHFEYLRDSTDTYSKKEDVMRLIIEKNISQTENHFILAEKNTMK